MPPGPTRVVRRGSGKIEKPTKNDKSKTGDTLRSSENQERAYIAASRRTDRSIEARMESAKRASDLHLQRTGRRLRITEDIVLKEEMYEEEDLKYEERARRREQWAVSSNYPNVFSTLPEARHFFNFQPTSNQTDFSLNSPVSPLSPISPHHHHQPLLSPALSNAAPNLLSTTPAVLDQLYFPNDNQNWPKTSPSAPPLNATLPINQDLSLQLSASLFGGPTTRPTGIKQPEGFVDFETMFDTNHYSQMAPTSTTASEDDPSLSKYISSNYSIPPTFGLGNIDETTNDEDWLSYTSR